MRKNDIKNPHDKLFRASMQYPEVSREFLETHLPKDIKSKLDFASVVVCPNTFIDEDLRLSQSDVLIKANIEGKLSYIYILVEHQSKPDSLMPFRLFKYMVKIWDYHQSHATEKKGLPFPAIVPMVFYSGKQAYNGSRTVAELCGENAELMRRVLIDPFCLIDVNTISEEILTSRLWSGTMEFILDHRFRQHINEGLDVIAKNIDHLMLDEKKGQFVLQLINYMVEIDKEHRSYQEIIDLIMSKISPKAGDEIMNLAEVWKEEGREEGALNERINIARKFLAEGIDPVFVAKNTGLSLDQVKNIQKTLKK